MPRPLNRHGRARPRPPRLPILALTVLLAACATGVKEAEYLYRPQED